VADVMQGSLAGIGAMGIGRQPGATFFPSPSSPLSLFKKSFYSTGIKGMKGIKANGNHPFPPSFIPVPVSAEVIA
jgi:hypothetical protein